MSAMEHIREWRRRWAWRRFNHGADRLGLSKRERYEMLKAVGVTLPSSHESASDE